jgi:hypothetical protein
MAQPVSQPAVYANGLINSGCVLTVDLYHIILQITACGMQSYAPEDEQKIARNMLS